MSTFFSVYIAIFIPISLITCLSSYDSIIGLSTMPRSIDAMSVGYSPSNDTILLIGGFAHAQQFITFKDNEFTDMGERYLNASQSTWSYSQHYTTLDDTLWIINKNGNDLLWINLQTYATTTASFTLPINVGLYGCLTSLQTHLIVLGGRDEDNNALNTVQIYDLSISEWHSNAPSLLTPRSEFACLTVNNRIYAIGGGNRSTSGSSFLSSIEVLNASNIAQITSENWYELMGTLHQAAKGIRAVKNGNDIIVIGGQADDSRLTHINIIDTMTGTCQKVGDLSFGTSYAASIIVHNILYIFGGWSNNGTAEDRYQIIYLPTASPTTSPTLISTAPSISTSAPTKTPTRLPTDNPTKLPSFVPSYDPISVSTIDPTSKTQLIIMPTHSQTPILSTTIAPKTILSQTSPSYDLDPSNTTEDNSLSSITLLLKVALVLLVSLIICVCILGCVVCWKAMDNVLNHKKRVVSTQAVTMISRNGGAIANAKKDATVTVIAMGNDPMPLCISIDKTQNKRKQSEGVIKDIQVTFRYDDEGVQTKDDNICQDITEQHTKGFGKMRTKGRSVDANDIYMHGAVDA